MQYVHTTLSSSIVESVNKPKKSRENLDYEPHLCPFLSAVRLPLLPPGESSNACEEVVPEFMAPPPPPPPGRRGDSLSGPRSWFDLLTLSLLGVSSRVTAVSLMAGPFEFIRLMLIRLHLVRAT